MRWKGGCIIADKVNDRPLNYGRDSPLYIFYSLEIIIINLTPQRTFSPRPSRQAVPLSICLGTVGASIVQVSVRYRT